MMKPMNKGFVLSERLLLQNWVTWVSANSLAFSISCGHLVFTDFVVFRLEVTQQ